MAQDVAKTAQESSKSEFWKDLGWIWGGFCADFGRIVDGFLKLPWSSAFDRVVKAMHIMYLVRKRKHASMRLAPWTSWACEGNNCGDRALEPDK